MFLSIILAIKGRPLVTFHYLSIAGYFVLLTVFLKLFLQVLPENEGEDYIYGMLAFALLEIGQLREAEEAAKRGFEINKHDSWSQHAVG